MTDSDQWVMVPLDLIELDHGRVEEREDDYSLPAAFSDVIEALARMREGAPVDEKYRQYLHDWSRSAPRLSMQERGVFTVGGGRHRIRQLQRAAPPGATAWIPVKLEELGFFGDVLVEPPAPQRWREWVPLRVRVENPGVEEFFTSADERLEPEVVEFDPEVCFTLSGGAVIEEDEYVGRGSTAARRTIVRLANGDLVAILRVVGDNLKLHTGAEAVRDAQAEVIREGRAGGRFRLVLHEAREFVNGPARSRLWNRTAPPELRDELEAQGLHLPYAEPLDLSQRQALR